ncbi:MAG: hypothetical protein PHS60_13310, partial [Zavarzinia sp.]|nr:hypothetical protein [Zavarzinia sp.]
MLATGSGPALADEGAPDWPGFAATGKIRAAAMAEAFDAIATAIDRRIFEADTLAPDFTDRPEAAIAFVGNEIRYEPYAGLLRGADGTLSAGAGNDLDQAVLLARLLRSAGAEVELLRARLAPEDARRLLASLPAQGTESRAVLAGDGRDAALAALSALSGRPVPLPRSPAAAGFATPAAVTATVAALGPETAPPDTLIDEV